MAGFQDADKVTYGKLKAMIEECIDAMILGGNIVSVNQLVQVIQQFIDEIDPLSIDEVKACINQRLEDLGLLGKEGLNGCIQNYLNDNGYIDADAIKLMILKCLKEFQMKGKAMLTSDGDGSGSATFTGLDDKCEPIAKSLQCKLKDCDDTDVQELAKITTVAKAKENSLGNFVPYVANPANPCLPLPLTGCAAELPAITISDKGDVYTWDGSSWSLKSVCYGKRRFSDGDFTPVVNDAALAAMVVGENKIPLENKDQLCLEIVNDDCVPWDLRIGYRVQYSAVMAAGNDFGFAIQPTEGVTDAQMGGVAQSLIHNFCDLQSNNPECYRKYRSGVEHNENYRMLPKLMPGETLRVCFEYLILKQFHTPAPDNRIAREFAGIWADAIRCKP
jgi:hypothetical protein